MMSKAILELFSISTFFYLLEMVVNQLVLCNEAVNSYLVKTFLNMLFEASEEHINDSFSHQKKTFS